ncbi:hypothetical protein AVEN_188079-1 [Araneus ventricosus]|uniref:Uncharacterized protein n=1 Tax=Araneus ventricosus TaxID=182803 RepID=A0A4Y2URI2_ARAVE|nr:hypothetical protein AVEN_188079-1 [Araneus ventricosus]
MAIRRHPSPSSTIPNHRLRKAIKALHTRQLHRSNLHKTGDPTQIDARSKRHKNTPSGEGREKTTTTTTQTNSHFESTLNYPDDIKERARKHFNSTPSNPPSS